MEKIPSSVEEAFFAGRRGEAVRFCINDAVDIVGGPNTGSGGAVISIVSLSPEVTYLVELGSGTDVIVSQDQIQLVEGDSRES